jgi:hypothetical protein
MMKKNFFLIVLTLVLVITVGYGAQNMKKHANLTALVLENVEALANDESGNGSYTCYNTFTPADWFHSDQYFVHCYYCVVDKGRDLRDQSSCSK